jgi:Sulfatase
MTRRRVALGAALLFLNVSLTFENVWPTPAITWHGRLSLELALSVLVMALIARGRPLGARPNNSERAPGRLASPAKNRHFSAIPARVARRLGACCCFSDTLLASKTLGWFSAVWTLLVVGRYAEVTAPALYGRDVNLYWDLRFIPDVVAMGTRVVPLWLIVVCLAAAGSVLAMLCVLIRAAWLTIAAATGDWRQRRLLIVASALVTLSCAIQQGRGHSPSESAFAVPVTLTYARQVRFVAQVISGSAAVGASPAMDSDLSRVRGADVFLVFIESYGAVSFDRREVAERLAAARTQLETAARAGNRDAVSAYVESPTFGGSSWLAHLSLLSGIDVRDPRTNAQLMTERRNTLVRVFARRGFRTVALMPGLRQSWPEGVFYGFDEIYGAGRLAYRGPEFGWFSIPDQYSMERLDALEVSRSPRAPLFVFFPTLSTHFPFNPTPPYQPDWPRMTTERPYDGPAIVRAYARQPDWMNFMPGYVDAMSYDLTTLAGYLERHTNQDLVMILLGDHQPPALVTGQGASWDVPVHVITSRTSIRDRLLARGFRPGFTPDRPALARMHALLPILIEAFGDPE